MKSPKFGNLKPGSGDGDGDGGSRGPSLVAKLLAPLRQIGALLPVLLIAALIAGAVVGLVSLFSGEGEDGQPAQVVLQRSDSSWIAGQGSLVGFPGYISVADRAEQLGDLLGVRRRRDVAAREAAIAEARRRASAEARRKFLEAKRRARELFLAAQRRAERLRKKQQEELARQKREQARLLAQLRRKFRVEPGEECRIPEIRAIFDCETGYPF